MILGEQFALDIPGGNWNQTSNNHPHLSIYCVIKYSISDRLCHANWQRSVQLHITKSQLPASPYARDRRAERDSQRGTELQLYFPHSICWTAAHVELGQSKIWRFFHEESRDRINLYGKTTSRTSASKKREKGRENPTDNHWQTILMS